MTSQISIAISLSKVALRYVELKKLPSLVVLFNTNWKSRRRNKTS